MRFTREVQVNYRTFSSSTEPDLLPKINERLTCSQAPEYDIAGLRKSPEQIHSEDIDTERREEREQEGYKSKVLTGR
jgi:hypothetical protein